MKRYLRVTIVSAGFLCLLVLLPLTGAQAATKYVGTTGTDSLVAPNGTAAATPWRTFHFAVANLAAGDTLIVLPGTYDLAHEASDTTINISVSDVTIQGQTAGTAIIDGNGALTWLTGIIINADNVVIHKLVFKRFQSGGINISASTGTDINQNIVYDNGTSGATGTGISFSSVVSCQIRNNEVYWSGDTNYRQGSGIQVAFGVGSNTNVQFNTVYGHSVTGYRGIIVNIGSAANVTQNVLYDNDVGIYCSDSDPNVSLNELYDNRVGIQVSASGSSFASVWNNLIYKTSGTFETGILVEMLSAGTMVPEVYHNTIDGGAFYGVRVQNTGANPDIRYNMITNFSAGAGISNIGGGAPTMRYNNIFGCGTAYSGTTAGTGDAGLAPGYVGGTDYHLTASSPCRDLVPAGEADIVSADFEGVPRPAGVPRDPGCYEYGAAAVNSVSVTFPPGVLASQYICAAIPLNLNDPTPVGTFGPQIGTYDTTLMRIGHWEPDIPGYLEYPGTDDDAMYPGDGIWFLFRNGATITFNGSPVSTTPDPKDGVPSYYIPLRVGWNQVGNPFTHPVAISNMVVSNNDGTPAAENLTTGTLSQGIFWMYQDGQYYAASKLPVAGGGWILKLNEEGKLWVKDVSVAYPDMSSATSFDLGLYDVPAHYDRPPAPPGDIGGGWSSSGGGGGGGGCFIQSLGD